MNRFFVNRIWIDIQNLRPCKYFFNADLDNPGLLAWLIPSLNLSANHILLIISFSSWSYFCHLVANQHKCFLCSTCGMYKMNVRKIRNGKSFKLVKICHIAKLTTNILYQIFLYVSIKKKFFQPRELLSCLLQAITWLSQ